jgi:hypothetical protein
VVSEGFSFESHPTGRCKERERARERREKKDKKKIFASLLQYSSGRVGRGNGKKK